MLEYLFGNANIEKIFFFILINKNCYAAQLSRQFNSSLCPLQKSLQRLERGGILVSFFHGKTRVFKFNPRYPFLMELESFLNKAYTFLPGDIKSKYYESIIRKRPRKTGKPI